MVFHLHTVQATVTGTFRLVKANKAQWLWPSLCSKTQQGEWIAIAAKLKQEVKYFFCMCECIKAQLTRLHSASPVIEPCSETAAQLEHREMEEYMNPPGHWERTHIHVHTWDTRSLKSSRSSSTPTIAPAVCLLLKCPQVMHWILSYSFTVRRPNCLINK